MVLIKVGKQYASDERADGDILPYQHVRGMFLDGIAAIRG
jgi:hypothetical protein